MDKIVIRTENAPAPIGPYNQAVLAGETLYISGQICMDPLTNELKNKFQCTLIWKIRNFTKHDAAFGLVTALFILKFQRTIGVNTE